MAGGTSHVFPRWLTSSRSHPATLAFALLLLVFVLTFGWMAWAGNRAFMPILFDTDVALFHSVMKHALQGELPRFYNLYTGTWTHYFARDHFNPEIFLILPLWTILPSNITFAWVQIGVSAATAAFLFAIARWRLGSPAWGLILGAAFLLSPLPSWSLYNHATSAPFVPLFLAWMVWALFQSRRVWYWLGLAGLLLAREDAAILGMAVGAYAWLGLGRRPLGWITLGICAAYLPLMILVVIPALGEGTSYPYIAHGYGWLGRTPREALGRVISEPGAVLERLRAMGGLRGLTLQLLPFAFTPLASWRGLLLLLPVGYLALHPHASPLAYHYGYWAAAMTGLAAVEGVRQLKDRLAGLRSQGLARAGLALLGGVILILAVGAHVQAGYSPVARAFDWREFTAGPRERAMRMALEQIPPESRVTASRVLLTHLVPFAEVECPWEYVEVREEAGHPGLGCRDRGAPVTSEYLLVVDPRDSPAMRWLLASGEYGTIFLQRDVALLRRGAPPEANAALAYRVLQVRPARTLPREVGTVVFDERAVAGSTVKADRGVAGLVAYGWYRRLCPGRYEATLRARAPGAAGDLGRLEVVTDAGTTLVADREIRGADLPGEDYHALALPFELGTPREVEVRVRATGLAELWIDEVSLAPLDPRPSAPAAAEGAAC